MTFKTLFLTSDGAGAVQYTAADFRRHIDRTWTTGVLNGLAVSTDSAMNVQIAAGDAVMPSATNEGKYLAWETAATTGVAIPSAPVTVGQSQNHLVCLFTKDPAASGGTSGRVTVPVVLSGTAATTGLQTDPSVPAFHEVLARVTVPQGTAAITGGMITDLRSFATLDGDYVDDANATRLGTALLVNGAVVRRGTSGQIAIGAGTASDHAATKGQLDAFVAATANIGDSQVTSAKIANGTIVDGDLAARTSGTVTTSGDNINYEKRAGIVHVWGDTGSGNPTLPDGYKPAAQFKPLGRRFSTGDVSQIVVTTAGEIQVPDRMLVDFSFVAA